MGIAVQILIALVLGSILGLAFPPAGEYVSFLGDIFLAALKMIIMPLIITSMLSGVAGIGSPKKLGELGGKTIAYYVTTTLIAVVIGLVLVNLVKPGEGFKTDNGGDESAIEERVEVQSADSKAMTISEFLHTQIDKLFENPFKSASEGNVLGVIVFSLILGIGLLFLGERSKPVFEMVDVLLQGIMKIVHWIMYFAPFGVFGLMTQQVSESGVAVFSALLKYIGVVLSGLAIHSLFALPVILLVIGGYNPLRLAIGVKEALLLAFSTSSSSATMPVTMANLEENLEMPNEVVGFVVPLGATINMDGTALYEAVAALFIAQAFGVELSLGQQVIVALTATLAAIGAAGIPSAGLVTMAIVLSAVNLPLEGIGMILAVDRFLDMCRTTVNVWGDVTGVAVISRFFKVSSRRRGNNAG